MVRIAWLIIAVISSISATGALAAEGNILPSEMTVLTNHAMLANPDADRRSITAPLIARMQTEELDELERFMKGEAHFLHLQPEESRDEFWQFRERDDNIGRVANQRLMIIRINAFQMADELLNDDIPRYRDKFGVDSSDRYGITFPVTRTAQQLIARGDVDAALDLIVEEVRTHDEFDAPYMAYSLAGQFMQTAIDNGRADEFVELNEWVLAGLNKAIETRLKSMATNERHSYEVQGAVFRSLFEDQLLSYHDWTAKFIALRNRIAVSNED